MRGLLCVAAAAFVLAAGHLPASAQTIKSYRHLVLDGHSLKWGKPVLGTGASVTYALVENSVSFAGARNCSSMAPLDNLLARNAIGTAAFMGELRQAFAVWEAAADISFAPADAAVADILVGAQADPVGYAFANVEYDETQAGAGPRSISRSMVCLNPLRHWKIGFDGDLDVYDLRYTLMHEIGHAIGLNHPKVDGQLMAYAYRETFRVLQMGDIRGVELLYGSREATPKMRVGKIHRNDVSIR